MLTGPARAPQPLLVGVHGQTVLHRRAQPGHKGATLQLVDPFALKAAMGDAIATDNETSLVLAVESAGRRLLLTGDLEGPALARFIASDPDSCDVLVAPHHGSRTSLPPEIARVTAADWVIVSGAGTAGWPEVREAYAGARGDGGRIAVVKTGADEGSAGGAIAVTLTASRVCVEQFGGGQWREVPPDRGQEAPGGSRGTPGENASPLAMQTRDCPTHRNKSRPRHP